MRGKDAPGRDSLQSHFDTIGTHVTVTSMATPRSESRKDRERCHWCQRQAESLPCKVTIKYHTLDKATASRDTRNFSTLPYNIMEIDLLCDRFTDHLFRIVADVKTFG